MTRDGPERPRFIEFVGLSGAGKSTIARHVLTQLPAAGVPALSRNELLADQASFLRRQAGRSLVVGRGCTTSPGLMAGLARAIARAGQRRPRDLLKVTWNFWTVAGLVTSRRRRPGPAIVLDQGLFQALWSVGYSAGDDWSAAGFDEALRRFGLSDFLFVVVEASPEIARERLAAREVRDTRMQSGGAGDDAWRRADSIMRETLAALRRLVPENRIVTVRSDRDGGPEELAAAVVSRYMAVAHPSEDTGRR